jgi:hypothetical protein
VRRSIAVLMLVVASSPTWATAWCGMYARHHLVYSDPGPRYNLACNWLDYGSSTYAHEGAIVVWCAKGHHHVGKITGPCRSDANGNRVCVVTSGNDGGAVRTRERSVAGAQFRM